MSISFIIGRAGSGKTYLCQQEILCQLNQNDSTPLILLVPEQATYQAEQTFINNCKIKGFARLHILSFQRLGFHLQGRFFANRHISRLGQNLVIGQILKSNKNQLKVFSNSADQPGTARQIADIITELHKSEKDNNDLTELIEKLSKNKKNTLTSAKFEDIAFIYAKYQEFIKDKKFFDSDYELSKICRKIPASPLICQSMIWVDGFSDFTFQEQAILLEMLKSCKQARIALCMDGTVIDSKDGSLKELEKSSLFYPTQSTYSEFITEIIPKTNKPLLPPSILNQQKRFEKSKPLEILERNLFDDSIQDKNFSANDNIAVVCAVNARSEVEWTARKITELVHRRQMRWKDIAVIVPNLESYKYFIEAVFNDYQIPFFLDAKKTIHQDRLIIFLTAALSFACQDFEQSDIIAYLKCGFLDIRNQDIDLLENYCIAAGIKAQDWNNQNWKFNIYGFDEGQINTLKNTAIKELIWLKDKTNSQMLPFNKFVRILNEFLEINEIEKKLPQDLADFYKSIFAKLEEMFETTSLIFGDEQLDISQFKSLFVQGVSQLKVSFVPLMIDQVLVGSIDRSRHPDIKAAFLLGTSQKNFPAGIQQKNLLTETDRTKAQASGFEMISSIQRQIFSRQYLAYIAFTRPSDSLYITYPLTDEKGSAVGKSQFVEMIEDAFKGCSLRYCGINDQPESINNTVELVDYLSGIASISDKARQAAQQFLQGISGDNPQFQKTAEKLSSLWDYKNEPVLDSELAGSFFSNPMRISVSRLICFAECPFKYFADYMLALKQRKTMAVEAVDRGTFYHKVLEIAISQLTKDKCLLADTDKDKLKEYIDNAFEQAIDQDNLIKVYIQKSRHNTYSINSAKEILEDFIFRLSDMAKASKMQIESLEKKFGGDSLQLQLENGLKCNLRGFIDRLDTLQIEDKKYALVFDYKSSEKSFNISKFNEGLDLQLTVYLLAAKSMGYEPIGAFYINITAGMTAASEKAKGILNGEHFRIIDSQTESGWSNFYNFQIKTDGTPYGSYDKSGAYKPDDFEKLIEMTEDKIKKICSQILSGNISISPYRISGSSACQNCDYKPLCRFDWLYNDFRNIKSIKKEELFS